MVSNAAFTHSREMVRSMTLDQVKTLQAELESRLEHIFIADKVFAIPELMENILAQLDFYEIFAVMRVNRHFRDTILGSNRLLRKTFIAPAQEMGVNPFLFDVLFGLYFDLRGHCFYSRPEMQSRRSTKFAFVIEQDNLLRLVDPPQGHWERVGGKLRLKGKKRVEVHGSWANTRIIGPLLPVSVRFTWENDDMMSEQNGRRHIMEPHEATLGALYDLAVSALEYWANDMSLNQHGPNAETPIPRVEERKFLHLREESFGGSP